MATTKIHSISTSPDNCINYGINDKAGHGKDDIADGISYAVSDKTGLITYMTLSSYQNCTEANAIRRFHYYAEKGRGTLRNETPRTKNGNEVVAWHLHQNFEGHEVPPHVANEIGAKLAREMFGSFACTISTHTNTNNIHNHIVVCAWDKEGRKWNNCNSNYRKIRQVSDRLCEEYGLGVLYKTHEMKLVSYKDKDGKQRYYEPTDRKNELIKAREDGNISGNIDDYRNTESYLQTKSEMKTNRDVIKKDIDNLLPTARSYEELLDRLRDLGYTINDKKKDGGWLKHVSFTAPCQDKGTRDSSLGDGQFYTRENLTKYIDEHASKKIEQEDASQAALAVKHIGDYEYGETNLDDIDDCFRTSRNANGSYTLIQRSDIEKSVIADIRKNDAEVRVLIDTSGIQKIIREQEHKKKQGIPTNASKREEILIEQIRDSFENLRFIEKHGIYSYDQINNLYKAVYESYNRNLEMLAQAKQLVDHFNHVLELPHLAAELKSKIDGSLEDEEYMFEEYDDDINRLAEYHDMISKYDINGEEGESTLRAKVGGAEKKIAAIENLMEGYSKEITGYEKCVATLNRIDIRNNRNNNDALAKFYEVRNAVVDAKQSIESRLPQR